MSGINTLDFVRGVEQASGIYSTVLKEYSVENERLENENAKLQELALDMYGYAFNREIELCNECACADDGDCGACGEYDGACGIAKRRFEELYSDRIRELGIEYRS